MMIRKKKLMWMPGRLPVGVASTRMWMLRSEKCDDATQPATNAPMA
jgi:hypothetical protein